ncbi:MAG: hypothetical protein M0C28_11755 [Candidatus Moduliflexus flocculans]|nr:hypothetical protein [Candidatus Moduliflexus flocculans]
MGPRRIPRARSACSFPRHPRARDPAVFDRVVGRRPAGGPRRREPRSLTLSGQGFSWSPPPGRIARDSRCVDTDLAKLTGLPAVLAQLVGFTLPEDLGGRLTADVDLAGRGTDLATLARIRHAARGRASAWRQGCRPAARRRGFGPPPPGSPSRRSRWTSPAGPSRAKGASSLPMGGWTCPCRPTSAAWRRSAVASACRRSAGRRRCAGA